MPVSAILLAWMVMHCRKSLKVNWRLSMYTTILCSVERTPLAKIAFVINCPSKFGRVILCRLNCWKLVRIGSTSIRVFALSIGPIFLSKGWTRTFRVAPFTNIAGCSKSVVEEIIISLGANKKHTAAAEDEKGKAVHCKNCRRFSSSMVVQYLE